MSRRRGLPGADELFRTTGGATVAAVAAPATAVPVARGTADRLLAEDPGAAASPDTPTGDGVVGESGARRRSTATRRRPSRSGAADRRPTGRERHDEKITVYVSADELLDLEHARLTLRGDHGLAVDRGRIVREALAVVLADLDTKGDSSILVRRLRGR